MAVIEIAVDSAESAVAAERGGARRLELCSALSEGGLTPSLGLVRTVRLASSLAVYTMIRPRGGDFLYNEGELRTMEEDIRIMAQEGVDGVVLGVLTEHGQVDIERTRHLRELARPMDVTFHRAIDMTAALEGAVEDVIAAGVQRILTSGGETSAWAGRERLRRLVQQTAGRAVILVGGGVRPAELGALMACTGAEEFHSSMRRLVPGPMKFQSKQLSLGGPGENDFDRAVVFGDEVRALVDAARAVEETAP